MASTGQINRAGPSAMGWMERAFDAWLLRGFAKLQYFVGGCLLVSEVIIVAFDTLFRNLHLPNPIGGGANELVELQMGILAALVLSHTWFLDAHIRIDLVRDHVKPRARALIDAFSAALGFLYCAAVTMSTWGSAVDNLMFGFKTDALRIPIAPFLFLFSVSFGHFALILLVSVWKNLWCAFVRADRAASPGQPQTAAPVPHQE